MKAQIRYLDSPDANLNAFWPEDPTDVGLLIQVFAGPADGPGEESFDLMVCTPRWLERTVRRDGPLIGRHYVIVAEFDLEQVRAYLHRLFESEEAENWHELGLRLARYGHWEFEDYRE